jgi:nucleoside-specific outer membrane channel protein Tsx
MKSTSAVASTLAALALPLSAADWSDTCLGYRHSTQFREPGIDGTVEKKILQLNHASGWAYGGNFFDVDMLTSSENDPSLNGNTGASEVYVVYRGSLSLGKIAKKDMSFGPVRDLSITAGFDFNAKNNAFAAKKRFLVLGPTFNLDMPAGFFDIGVWACHEQNYNGIVGKSVDYKATWMISASWGIPFETGPVAAKFEGYLNYVAPKGKDGFGVETTAETLSNVALLVDLGSPFNVKGKLFAGVGFEYWNHKFGLANSDGPAPGTNKRVTAPMLMVQFHF